MTRTLLSASLILTGVAAVATAQVVIDAPGVTVSLNGSTLIHRTPVNYPSAVQERGAQGTVMAEVKVDSAGNVSDVQIVSGPDDLRRPVLESVLQWHFTRDAAGSRRNVQVSFDLSAARAPNAGRIGDRPTETFVNP